MLIKEKNYKIIIIVLLTTNVIFHIIIAVLFGEIYSLQENLSNMTEAARALEDKISRMEIEKEGDDRCTVYVIFYTTVCTIMAIYFEDIGSELLGGE